MTHGYMAVYILNLFDVTFTIHALGNGAVETNPLMRCVPAMVVYKTIVIGALCWWLGQQNGKLARYGLWVITAVYGAVVLWHIVNLSGG